MCSCKHHRGSAAKAAAVEPNPRLIMAVVAIGVIIGALFTPSKNSKEIVAQTPVAATTADHGR